MRKMLGKFQWALMLLSVFYLLGTVTFYFIERHVELEGYRNNRKLYDNMKELYSFHHCSDPAFATLDFCQSQEAFSDELEHYFNRHATSIKDKQRWTVMGTMFFLTHLSTTIGYGNCHPQTSLGRVATVIFAVIGLPIMGYTLALVAEAIITSTSYAVEKTFKTRVDTVQRKTQLLWVLLFIVLFGGAYIYTVLEQWSYLESLYFCFVTLSTVGFGDYLPHTGTSQIFSILYIIFGLGLCASLIATLTGFVEKGHHHLDEFLDTTCDECWARDAVDRAQA
eukprot:GEMP01077190.1.p1 GENE.GEMP01077190.1~~GEMP01077190.1.p1  ORF type:complete len:280 (+),score=42.38 GEMP01077190.1:121-960(+)